MAKTNNPNATPTATANPVAKVRTQEEIERQRQMEMLFAQQQELLKLVQPGMVNPVKGTKSMVRRTMSGQIEDPNAPTGLAWLEAFGPNSQDPNRQTMLAARQAQADADAGPMSVRMQKGREAVAKLKAEQEAQGLRTAFDDGQPDRRGQVVQTPGTDQRVAYDQNGMPIGFTGGVPTGPNVVLDPYNDFKPIKFGAEIPRVPGMEGGFNRDEKSAFNQQAIKLAGEQALAGWGEPPKGEVTVGPVEEITTPPIVPPSTQGVLGYEKAPGEAYNFGDMVTAGVRRLVGQSGRTAMDQIINYLASLIGDAGIGASAPTKRPVSPPISGEVDAFGYPIPKNY